MLQQRLWRVHRAGQGTASVAVPKSIETVRQLYALATRSPTALGLKDLLLAKDGLAS